MRRSCSCVISLCTTNAVLGNLRAPTVPSDNADARDSRGRAAGPPYRPANGARIGAEVEVDATLAIAGDHRLQDEAPIRGAVDVARPEERPLEIAALVELQPKCPPRRALLSSAGWALGTIHVENDVVGRFAGVAAFAKPEIYERLEQEKEGIQYAIRLPANDVLQRRIGHLLTRPVGRSPKKPIISFASFRYQAKDWTRPRRVVARVEWHQGELYPRVGFIVTNLSRPSERVVKFYNGRGTAEQWIKEGKNALRWTRLSCRPFRRSAPPASRARLQHRELRAHAGFAQRDRTVVADDAPRKTGRDRRPDRAPRPIRGVRAG